MLPNLDSVKRRIDGYVAASVQDGDDCADVSQICLIKVWLKGHTFRGDSAFDSWLYRVVHNEVVDGARREARRLRILERVDGFDGSTHDLEERTLDRVGVQRLLSRMSGIDRQIVELTYVHDLTSVGVGAILGLAPSSVRCRLLRLRRDGADLTSAPTRRVAIGAAG